MTHEIPRHQWAPFLENFSLEHAGNIVSLERRLPGMGVIVEAENSPFRAVIDEHTNGNDRVAIVLGDSSSASRTHIIDEPLHIYVEISGGLHREIEIDTTNGTVTVLRLRNEKLD